ncbi:MAG: AAA family ATPase [Acidobacteriota bacterium]
MIVGLTGPNAAGKGEVARILREMGFRYWSLSDIVREEATALGRTHGRDDLIRTGQELRRAHGTGVLAERIAGRLADRDLVDSIRSPAEVDVLRRVRGFELLGVTAPIEVRYERATARPGRGDALESLEAFRAKEAEEDGSDPGRQQLSAALARADHVIDNRGSVASLEAAVRSWIRDRESARR